MRYLRQSTASQILYLGLFLDSGDGDTPETGLTIANTDILLHKHGTITMASKNSGGATHISGGHYYCTLDATDTNTLGDMTVSCHPTGALENKIECCVLPANIYDAWIAGTDYQQVDAVQVEGSDATDQIRDSVVDDSTRIDGSALNTLAGHDPGENIMGATDLATEMARIDVDLSSRLATAGYTAPDNASIAIILSRIIGTLAAGTHNAQSGDAYAVVNNVTYGLSALKTLIDMIIGYVDELESRLTAARAAAIDNIDIGESVAGVSDVSGLSTFDPALDTVANVTNCANNADMRGTDGANTVIPDAAGTAAALHATTNAAIAVIDGIVDDILVDTGTTIPAQISGLSIPTTANITAAILAMVVEGTLTFANVQRIVLAALAGKTTDNGTNFRDIADSKNRIQATLDANNNRTAMTLDGS